MVRILIVPNGDKNTEGLIVPRGKNSNCIKNTEGLIVPNGDKNTEGLIVPNGTNRSSVLKMTVEHLALRTLCINSTQSLYEVFCC